MKKWIIGALSLISLTSIAQDNVIQDNLPRLKLAVYDFSTSTPKEVGRTYSLSNKHHRLCWTAFNMPFEPLNNQVTQIFTTPDKNTKFTIPAAKTEVSENGLSTIITTTQPSSKQGVMENCWEFEKTDPLGKYTLAVQINDIVFSAIDFNVIN